MLHRRARLYRHIFNIICIYIYISFCLTLADFKLFNFRLQNFSLAKRIVKNGFYSFRILNFRQEELIPPRRIPSARIALQSSSMYDDQGLPFTDGYLSNSKRHRPFIRYRPYESLGILFILQISPIIVNKYRCWEINF